VDVQEALQEALTHSLILTVIRARIRLFPDKPIAHSTAMGYARSKILASDGNGYYHCISRCVRQSFLCGVDRSSGHCFEHRRQWIEHRILEISRHFAVSTLAYSVMSNHFHVVLKTNSDLAAEWSAKQVAIRWLKLFPGPKQIMKNPKSKAQLVKALTEDPDRIKVLRARLASVSWFMRSINEPIARRANKEENKKGRFWEGRFKCQALLDQRAVLSCMAYVDLNPVRAGKARSLEKCAFTSARKRLFDAIADQSPNVFLNKPLEAIAGQASVPALGLTERQYLRLVEWTGLKAYKGKSSRLSTIFLAQNQGFPENMIEHPELWLYQVKGTENLFFRAIGSLESLRTKASELGQNWLRTPAFLSEATIASG